MRTDKEGKQGCVDNRGTRYEVYDVEDTDGIDGVEIILKKVQIARQWLLDEWNVDLDALRAEVQKRQTSYDMDALRKQVYDMQ